MSDRIYPGTIGLPIRLILLDDGEVHDPSDATVRQITFARPDGTQVVRDQASGVTVGTDSQGRACLEYVTVSGDLDMVGQHRATGFLVDATGEWPAEPAVWRVYRSWR